MNISAVVPVYNEVEALPQFHQELTAALPRMAGMKSCTSMTAVTMVPERFFGSWLMKTPGFGS